MDSNQSRCWILIAQVASAMRDHVNRMDGGRVEKMTVAQEKVLCTVYRFSPEGIKLKEIAKRVNLSPGAVSQMIEWMVQEGLVERKSDPDDRRAVNIHVSKKSMVIRERVAKHFDGIVGSVLEEKTPEERDAFIAIMEGILQKLSPTRESVRRPAGEMLLSMEEFK